MAKRCKQLSFLALRQLINLLIADLKFVSAAQSLESLQLGVLDERAELWDLPFSQL
jgi:hypothetical protein